MTPFKSELFENAIYDKILVTNTDCMHDRDRSSISSTGSPASASHDRLKIHNITSKAPESSSSKEKPKKGKMPKN